MSPNPGNFMDGQGLCPSPNPAPSKVIVYWCESCCQENRGLHTQGTGLPVEATSEWLLSTKKCSNTPAGSIFRDLSSRKFKKWFLSALPIQYHSTEPQLSQYFLKKFELSRCVCFMSLTAPDDEHSGSEQVKPTWVGNDFSIIAPSLLTLFPSLSTQPNHCLHICWFQQPLPCLSPLFTPLIPSPSFKAPNSCFSESALVAGKGAGHQYSRRI